MYIYASHRLNIRAENLYCTIKTYIRQLGRIFGAILTTFRDVYFCAVFEAKYRFVSEIDDNVPFFPYTVLR